MRTTLLILATFFAVGCSKAETPAADSAGASPQPSATVAAPGGQADPTMAPGHPAVGSQGSAPAPGLTGTILETMDSGGYTYMKLKSADGETWVAVNKAKVTKGQSVTIAAPMPMDGFESKTLNRKFDHIIFGTLASEPAAAGAPAMPGMPGGTGEAPAGVPPEVAARHAAAASGPEVAEKISVKKAEGADARTVAELYAQRAALKGKPVTVRGKVVKFNGGIMGRNWIHLRDGSGSPEGKDNDLTVTTSDSVAKGDVVVVRGTVAVDRDLGAGYTYVVLVEDAKVTK